MTQRSTQGNRQGVRMRRFLLGSCAYAICVTLLALAHALGLIALAPVVGVSLLMLLANGAFYLLFRSGANERFADPSLTWAQVLTGTAILMVTVYYWDRDRALPLMVSLLVLSFGAFRFRTREFLTAAGAVLASHALVVNLLMWRRPETVNVLLEGFHWLTLACVLPCFALIGGRLSETRQSLRRTNDELGTALGTIQKMATHDTLTALPNRALF